MFRLIPLSLLLMLSGVVEAQILIQSLPVPAIGDSTVHYINISPDIDIGMAGADVAWEWTLQDTFGVVTRYEANDATSTFPMANRKLIGGFFDQFLSMSSTSWYQVGATGVDPIGFGVAVKTSFVPGLTELYAPISYLDTLQENAQSFTGIPLDNVPDSVLALLPIVPDSVRVVINLDREDIVDAYGTLNLNSTSYTVTRMRRTDIVDAHVQAKVSILPWVDVTNLLLGFLPEGITLQDTSVSLRYISDGVGYPLAQVYLDADGNVLSSEHSMDMLSAAKDIQHAVAIADIYPNPTTGQFTIDYGHRAGTSCHAIVLDMFGNEVAGFALSDHTTNTWSLPGLPEGIYVINILNASGTPVAAAKLILTSK